MSNDFNGWRFADTGELLTTTDDSDTFERGGILRARNDDEIVVSTDATNAEMVNGFMRAANGALLITTDATNADVDLGFLRSPAGALVVTSDATNADFYLPGLLRSPSLALVVTNAGSLAPQNVVPPNITGESDPDASASSGDILTVDNGTWTGSPTSFTYQWRDSGGDIPGETTNTYNVTGSEFTITCHVTATNAFGSTEAGSELLLVVGGP